MAARRWGRAVALGASAALAGFGGLAACGEEAATTCVDQSGATFCVTRKDKRAVEPTATGLRPGSDYTVELSGTGVPGGDDPHEPAVQQVSPDGSVGGNVLGVVGLLDPGLPEGAQIVFTGTTASGTAVTVTMDLPG